MTTNFATFGNELYTGKRSYNFVASKKIWFLIAAVAVALSILLPVALASSSGAGQSSRFPTSRPRTRCSARRPSQTWWRAAFRV
jgi:hypothetical protein